jgi:formylglycine-generating enzyme required for sulfatase activity
MEDGGYKDKRHWKAGGFGDYKEPGKWEEQLQYPSRPVVYVSWCEAAAYAAWAGGRLPTEAEWERAARGPREEYRKYPWGNAEPTAETANYFESKLGYVTPVGIFPEDCSPEGVFDMAGNCREWCGDWYEEGRSRVVRGGAFSYGCVYLRSADRVRDPPDYRSVDRGFRVVRVVPDNPAICPSGNLDVRDEGGRRTETLQNFFPG